MKNKNSYRIDHAKLDTWTKIDVIQKVIMPIIVTDKGDEKARRRYSKTNSKKLLTLLLTGCIEALVDKRPVMLYKLGNIAVHHKTERIGRNPKTGVEVMITARHVATLTSKPTGEQRITRSEMSKWVHGQLPAVNLDMVTEAIKAVHVLFSDVALGTFRIEFRNFGNFHPIVRGARVGRNPKTGEKVDVDEAIVVHFKQSRSLRKLLNP